MQHQNRLRDPDPGQDFGDVGRKLARPQQDGRVGPRRHQAEYHKCADSRHTQPIHEFPELPDVRLRRDDEDCVGFSNDRSSRISDRSWGLVGKSFTVNILR